VQDNILKGVLVSDQEIKLTLAKREIVRKGLNKLKNNGQIPAVIQNPGKESIVVSTTLSEAKKVFKQAGKRHPVTVILGKDNYLTIIKDVDFEPKKHTIRHIVFAIIKQDEKVETEVPIVLLGDAPAVKVGLHLNVQLDDVEIEAFPKDLPDEVSISIENLAEIGDKLLVSNIVAPQGVTILTEADRPIVTVEELKVQEEEPVEEETATEMSAEDSSQTEASEEE
jgi:large subunit ribosomal protein L25